LRGIEQYLQAVLSSTPPRESSRWFSNQDENPSIRVAIDDFIN